MAHAPMPLCWQHADMVTRWVRDTLLDGKRGMEYRQAGVEVAQVRDARAILEGCAERVYFWRCGPYVKVGFSKDVARRTRQFLRGRGCLFPDGIDPAQGCLLGTIPGGRNVETAIHRHLGPPVVGEWFLDSERVREALSQPPLPHAA